MRQILIALLLAVLASTFAFGDYVERIDGGGIIGQVNVETDKISVEDWDGKTYTFYREFIRRIRSQETGKFNTYPSKTKFDVHTDAPEKFALGLVEDLETFEAFIAETFGFEKLPKERITIRIFSSTKDYENHWDNRFGDDSTKKKTLAFFDANFKDVSSVYAGRETFTIIAPRVAMAYIMRVYPKIFTKPPIWLNFSWYKMFENARVNDSEVDMVGLNEDDMETIQKELKDNPFTFASFFDYQYPKLDRETEAKKDPKTRQREQAVRVKQYNLMVLKATAFLHYLADNSKKYGKKFAEMLDEMENYAEPIEAIISVMNKKYEQFEKRIDKWIGKYEGSSPWRLYFRAERYFLRKRAKSCLKILDEYIPKYPKFEYFRKLRAMVHLKEQNSEEAKADLKILRKNEDNAEMCMYFDAMLLIQEEEYRKAVDIFKQLIEADPTYYRCYEMLLNIFWEQDTNIVSEEDARKYVQIMKDNEPYSYTFILEAKFFMKIGEPENAKIPLQKAYRRDRGNSEIKKLQKERARQAREKNEG